MAEGERPALSGAGAPGGNVLFVTIDQLRADVLDGALSGIVPLPALERLQREGTQFSSCFAAAVPCGPSRASLMTGLHAFNHRSIRNGTPLAGHHATLGTELRKLGREPLLFGYGDIAPDPTVRAPADPDCESYEHPAAGFREIVEMRLEAPFAWLAHLAERGYPLPRPLPDRVFDLFRPVHPDGAAPAIDDPALYAAADSDTAFLADRTLSALNVRRDRPWTAHVTFVRPHPPLVAPDPYNRLVAREDLPPPAPPAWSHPFRDAWFCAPAHHGLFHGFDGNFTALSTDAVARLRAVYLGLVAEVDHHLGRLLDWLDTTGQAERTLIIVTADHGEMLGDQGFWGKDNVAAAAHRVPLIVRGPGIGRGEAVSAPTSSVDLAPTIIDWLGGEVPPAMDGVSLLPVLGGAAPDRKRTLLTEIEFGHPHRPTRFQRALGLGETACNAAILRRDDLTYVHFGGGLPPLLFDRTEDPDERRDRAGERPEAVSEMRARMLDLRINRADRRLTGFSFGA